MSKMRLLSWRNMKRQKIRTICLSIAIVISTFLMTIAMMVASSFELSYGNYLKTNRTFLMDAAINLYSQEDVDSIVESELVKESGSEYHLGYKLQGDDVMASIAYYTDEMYEMMGCLPSEGVVPKSSNEILLPKYVAEIMWPDCKIGSQIELEYTIDDKDVKDSFVISGFYDLKVNSRNMFLVSKEYYENKKQEYIQQGIDASKFHVTVALIFNENHNLEKNMNELLSEANIDIDSSEYMVNEEPVDILETSIRIIMLIVAFAIILIGSLLIVEIFELSLNNESAFYRSLYILGVTEREVLHMIFMQLFMIAIFANIVAIIVAVVSCKFAIVPFVNSLVTLDLETHVTVKTIVYPCIVSIIEVIVGLIMMIKHIKGRMSIIDKSKRMVYKKRTGLRFSNLLYRMTIRRVSSQKRAVISISLILTIGLILCNGICSYIGGFDINKYIGETLLADYIVHNSSFDYISGDIRLIDNESLAPVFATDKDYTASSASFIDNTLDLDDESFIKYRELLPESDYTDGIIPVSIYGLDDYFVEQMNIIKGQIDIEKFRTGNYIILDGISASDSGYEIEDGVNWWNVGDKVPLKAADGSVREYEVMAIVYLPYELGMGLYNHNSCDIYLPTNEWKILTGGSDPYIYLFDVHDEDISYWDNRFEELVASHNDIQYESAATIAKDNEDLFRQIKIIVIVLVAIILMAVLGGFFNIIINEMYQLKDEIVNLQRIGVSSGELLKQFVLEVISYISIGITLGCLLSPFIVRYFINDIIAEDYVKYTPVYIIDIIFVIAGAVIVLISSIIYKRNVIVEKFDR